MEIKTKISVDSAHRLSFHDGKCRNLHGHTWVIEVSIFKEKFENLIVDFGAIKSALKDLFDHKILVYEMDDVLMQRSDGFDRSVFPFETTAENLALFIKGFILKMFIVPEVDEGESFGVQVTVWETADNSATA